MKRQHKSKTTKTLGRGPLARKLLTSVREHQQEKVVNLVDWKQGKALADELQASTITKHQLKDIDPLHGLYTYGQHQLSILIEQLTMSPILEKLVDVHVDAEERYMPSGPPMSPLTSSYFTYWGSFDLFSSGAKKETFATIAIDFCSYVGTAPELIALFETMQASRMGVYKHLGASGDYLYLKELITNIEIKAICPSGYRGYKGELWYCRILPSPIKDVSIDYSVILTTPYVLGVTDNAANYDTATEGDWIAYFQRNFKKTKLDDDIEAYEHLMKYGLGKNYWNEYVFLAYQNHTPEMIWLTGFPDRPTSLPHSPTYKPVHP